MNAPAGAGGRLPRYVRHRLRGEIEERPVQLRQRDRRARSSPTAPPPLPRTHIGNQSNNAFCQRPGPRERRHELR
ncbi:hypothetical protein ACRAWF_19770, partial [Streptomyces sp. L7]